MRIYTISVFFLMFATSVFAQKRAANEPVVLKKNQPASASVLISKENAKVGKKGKKSLELAKKWAEKPVMPVMKENGVIYYPYGSSMPVVVCKPLKVCAIQLQSGEEIINKPQCGDTHRWKITPAKAEEGRPAVIYVKPWDSNLTTNLMINTNLRLYTIELKSRNDNYTPIIAFTYPTDTDGEWNAYFKEKKDREDKAAYAKRLEDSKVSAGTENLDFNYRITGNADWKPVRVYNNGVKTIIQMPKKMAETPVLLGVSDGEEVLINYRIKGSTYIVDQVFDEAKLIIGVGGDQKKIKISRI